MLMRYFSDVPPGFEGQPILYLLTVFSLLMITLLALEWVWRVTWGAFEQPHPLKHPVTVLRLILALAAISVIMRVGPLVARFILWRDLSPEQRFTTYGVSHVLDVLSFFPWSMAWLLGYLGMPYLHYQLQKEPIPVHLWPTRQQLWRPLKIGLAAFVISAAVTLYG